jgi:AraC-like DNA-binding protein
MDKKGGGKLQYYYESKPDTKNYYYINHKTGPYVAAHFHSAIELVIVRRWRMAATVNGKELMIEPGNGCFVNSFCIHSYSELEGDTEVYAFVGNRDVFDAVLQDIGGIPPMKFEFNDFSLLDKIIAYYNDSEEEGLRYAMFRSATSLILTIIAKSNPLLSITCANSSREICAVLQYISEHFTDALTLGSLSARFGYSPQYFSKMFHRYMKINLTEYIGIARINYAKKILDIDRTKSVAEIAFESGFSSVPTFYRAYKKVFGTLPRG